MFMFCRFRWTCKVGYYRTNNYCDECIDNCISCTDRNTCDACKTGYYGAQCHLRCPLVCLGNLCHIETGTCICSAGFTGNKCDSCQVGYYGDECRPCSYGCQDDCDGHSGTCSCKATHTGPLCNLPCTQIDMKCSVCSSSSLETSVCTSYTYGYYIHTNRTCVQCSNDCVEGQCNGSNGHCEKGCTYGLWNPKCDKNCSEKCDVCNQDNGDCLTCSLVGVFGANCDKPCSKTCNNASCHTNGSCTSGCISDYYGPYCDHPCPTNCARSGNATRCSHATSSCLFGCNDGFKGEGCMEVLNIDNNKDTVHVAAKGGGVAAAVIVVIVVGVGISIFIRRRNRTMLYDNVVRDTTAECPEHAYHGIHMNVSAVSAKQCSTTVVSTDYHNTSDRLSESPQQAANEEQTYEISL